MDCVTGACSGVVVVDREIDGDGFSTTAGEGSVGLCDRFNLGLLNGKHLLVKCSSQYWRGIENDGAGAVQDDEVSETYPDLRAGGKIGIKRIGQQCEQVRTGERRGGNG